MSTQGDANKTYLRISSFQPERQHSPAKDPDHWQWLTKGEDHQGRKSGGRLLLAVLWSEEEHWGAHRSKAAVEEAEMVEVMGGGFALDRHRRNIGTSRTGVL